MNGLKKGMAKMTGQFLGNWISYAKNKPTHEDGDGATATLINYTRNHFLNPPYKVDFFIDFYSINKIFFNRKYSKGIF